jgi:tetratricopeptide (TPR) repeat protein
MKSRLSRFTLVALSMLLLSSSGAADARKKFEKATVDPAEDNFKQGILLIRDRNYESAIDSMTQAIYFSRNHYNPNAYKYLGLCYKATRQYAKAIQALLEHLNQTQEPAADARIDLAECYLETGQIDKARESVRDSFRDAPTMKGTHRQRYCQGEISEKIGDLGDAVQFYSSAIDEKPTYTEAWMARARCYVKQGEFNKALADYRTLLSKSLTMRDINYEELYYEMGTCLYKRGDHQGALDHWRLCLEQNPESFDAHVALASMLDEEKHISSAVKEYQAALSSFPKSGQDAAKQKIEKRLLWLQSQLAPKDAPAEIKPSPSMRMKFDETEKRPPKFDQAPMPKDSGF